MTLEVLLLNGSNITARAEAEDADGLNTAARSLWDEQRRISGTGGELNALFLVEGLTSCMSEGRWP